VCGISFILCPLSGKEGRELVKMKLHEKDLLALTLKVEEGDHEPRVMVTSISRDGLQLSLSKNMGTQSNT
jgi:hypothetical protein